jgi:cell division septation protein DedD
MPSQTKAVNLSKSKTKVIKASQPIASKTSVAVMANEQSTAIQIHKRYHVIVASSIAKKRAEALAKELRGKGYNDAKVLISGKMVRVSIAESDNNEEAQKMLNKLSDETEYNNMWVMKEKSSPDKN